MSVLTRSGLIIKPLQVIVAVTLLLLTPVSAGAERGESYEEEATRSEAAETVAALVVEIDENNDGSGSTTESTDTVKSPEPVTADNNGFDQNFVVNNCDADLIAGDSVFLGDEADSDDPGTNGEHYKMQDNHENLPTGAPVDEPGNSYVAAVIPEDSMQVIAGESTRLTVTFTELGSTPLGSAQLFIPVSLSVDETAGVDITEGWGYRWEDPEQDSAFSRVLSIWALIDTGYLGRNQSVSAAFTATAQLDQTHGFETKAWQDALFNAKKEGVGTSSAVNNMAEGYNNPKINVWVNSADVLNKVRDNLNWHYVQTADIGLNSYADGQDWEPIGTDETPYIGGYNGSGFKIDKLKIIRSDEDSVGLFGKVSGSAIITGVSLTNVRIHGQKHVGALAGYLEKGVIRASFAEGDLAASGSFAGGLVGRNDGGTVIDSQASVNVTGKQYTGGLVGGNRTEGIVINSSAHGIIKGTIYVGGLVGSNRNRIENSHATGDVSSLLTGTVRIGGLAGYNWDRGEVINCYATGDVKADGGSYVGGLVGHNANASVLNSYASGFVTGHNLAGGLIGFNDFNGIIKNSYASGNVIGNSAVGGLVGYNLSLVENCYAAGSAKGVPNFVGGLVGKNTSDQNNQGTIINSYYAVKSGHPADIYGRHLCDNSMKEIASFAGWDIAETADFNLDYIKTWYIYAGEAFPKLYWQYNILTVKAVNQEKIYGTDDPLFSFGYTGFRPGDHEQILGGNLTVNRDSGESVGNYVIRPSGLTAVCNSYLLVYKDGLLTINPGTLIITAENLRKEYGRLLVFEGREYRITGLVEGDLVDSVLLTSSGSAQSAPAGDYLIVISEARGEGLENYNIIYENGSLTVYSKTPAFREPSLSLPGYDHFTAMPAGLGLWQPLVFVPVSLNSLYEPLITSFFINEGTGSDLITAVEAFKKVLQWFEANSLLFLVSESALIRIELAVTKAAICALELKLSDDWSRIEKTADAYAEALTVLAELGGYLSEDQLALVAELLNAVNQILSDHGIVVMSSSL